MKERMNFPKVLPEGYRSMLGLHHFLENCGLDKKLMDLVYLRASQINGCAFCIDMHWKDLRALGVSEQDLYMLNAWHEWPAFTDKERAALQWAESVTLLTEGFVPDAVYETARAHFSETELAQLTLAIVAINGWNRLSVAFRKTPGAYQPHPAAAEATV